MWPKKSWNDRSVRMKPLDFLGQLELTDVPSHVDHTATPNTVLISSKIELPRVGSVQ